VWYESPADKYNRRIVLRNLNKKSSDDGTRETDCGDFNRVCFGLDEKLPFAIQPWPFQKREKSPVLEDTLL
jgi:hypothetical protein